VPLDGLKRESIPQRELKAAGGDPKMAPSQLVAVLGRSDPENAGIARVAFTSDGETLISLTGPKTGRQVLQIWDATGRPGKSRAFAVPDNVHAVSGDGRTFAIRDSRSIRLLEMPSCQEKRVILAGDGLLALALDAKGEVVAGVTEDVVRLWRTADGEKIRTEDVEGVTRADPATLAISPDGKKTSVRSGHAPSTVRIHDFQKGKGPGPLSLRQLQAQAFSPDGKLLATGCILARTTVWDVAGGTPRHELGTVRDAIKGVAFSPDGKRLAVAGVVNQEGARQGVVRLYDVASGRELLSLTFPDTHCSCVAFSPEGRHLAVGNLDGTVYVLRLAEADKE
jgi:WD40 repeat protein